MPPACPTARTRHPPPGFSYVILFVCLFPRCRSDARLVAELEALAAEQPTAAAMLATAKCKVQVRPLQWPGWRAEGCWALATLLLRGSRLQSVYEFFCRKRWSW